MTDKIFLTGIPGVGKSTVLLKAVEELKRRGTRVGGMITREAREQDVRVGFRITDVLTGREGWLANVKISSGPRVGKYGVDLEGLEGIGVQAITKALHDPEVGLVIVDELGPMELFSAQFKSAVRESVASKKPVLGTIHYRANDPLLQEIRNARNIKIVTVTRENRSTLHLHLVEEITRRGDSVQDVPTKQAYCQKRD